MEMVLSRFHYWCRAKKQAQLGNTALEILPPESKSPILDWVPAMQRRRLSHYAKMALYVANKSAGDLPEVPVVFSSQHGDFHRTSKIIKDLAQQQPLSPTSFGLSVHNAVVGLYSILTNNQTAMNSIAAGPDTLAMAMIEAYGQLATGAQHVLVIYCDQPLPEDYQVFDSEASLDIACAFVLSKAEHSQSGARIQVEPCDTISKTKTTLAFELIKAMENSHQDTQTVVGATSTWQIKLHKDSVC